MQQEGGADAAAAGTSPKRNQAQAVVKEEIKVRVPQLVRVRGGEGHVSTLQRAWCHAEGADSIQVQKCCWSAAGAAVVIHTHPHPSHAHPSHPISDHTTPYHPTCSPRTCSAQEDAEQHAAEHTPAAGANRLRRFAETPASRDALAACPATGWQEMYDVTLAANGAEPPPSPPPGTSPGAGVGVSPGGTAAAVELPLDDKGCLPFYFLDAYENPDRPGAWLEGCELGLRAVSLARGLRAWRASSA